MGIFDFLKKNSSKAGKSNTIGTQKTTTQPISISVSYSQNEIVRIEDRIKGTKPVCDGLYPHEVLVLSYAPNYYESNNDFPSFWWYKYGIKNVQLILNSLASKGYIKQGSIADAISLEKLTTIKAELQKYNLKASGKKPDLIARLVESVSEESLSSVFVHRPYALTESGTQLLKKYEWIPYIHSHGSEGLNIWNLTDMVLQASNHSYRDVIWGYYNHLCMEYAKEGKFGLYRNCKFSMSEFVAEEKKYRHAFCYLCEVIAYDLSGLSNGFRMDFLSIYAKSYFPYERSTATMAPAITERTKKYSEKLGWSYEDLYQHLLEDIARYRLPFQLFSCQECANIVMAEIKGDRETLCQIYLDAEKRFRAQYNNFLR